MNVSKTPILSEREFQDSRQKNAKDRKCQLYRHFDKDGVLLYVGISHNFIGRASEHKLKSTWFNLICNITVEHFEDRGKARTAESIAIEKEKPTYNIQCSPEYKKQYQHERKADRQEMRRWVSLLEYVKGQSSAEPEALECVRTTLDMHDAGWGLTTYRLICVGYESGHLGASLVDFLNHRGLEIDARTERRILDRLSEKLPNPQETA